MVGTSKVEVPKPKSYDGKRDAKEMSNGSHSKKGSDKSQNQREGKKDKRKSRPKLKSFLCDGPHIVKECPKRKALSAMIERGR
ncbi:hypothetical protein KK475_28970, partial [Klebsiella pneumoniae]|uniref:hypothetical protein n=1 Tax=Klebsiella pneumoniae TaxID=573 RepID=UPI001BDFF514